jgi:hypothetical protein
MRAGKPQRAGPCGETSAVLMDGSMHIEKALGRANRLEPLHFLLSSSHDLVGVLGTIVRP